MASLVALKREEDKSCCRRQLERFRSGENGERASTKDVVGLTHYPKSASYLWHDKGTNYGGGADDPELRGSLSVAPRYNGNSCL
jgi:hypothetical protein